MQNIWRGGYLMLIYYGVSYFFIYYFMSDANFIMSIVFSVIFAIISSILWYISAGQYMKEFRTAITSSNAIKNKMWILVIGLPILYVISPHLLEKVSWMPARETIFHFGILMYAFMFIGTKKILWPIFAEKTDALWKFAVIYAWATFILNIFAIPLIATSIVVLLNM